MNQYWYKKDEDRRYCGYQKRAGTYNFYHAPVVPNKKKQKAREKEEIKNGTSQ